MDNFTHIMVVFCVVLTVVVIGFGIGSYTNLDYVKSHAHERWNEVGFEVIGYDGYQWGHLGFGTDYGGAKVRYTLRRVPDNGIIYTGFLQRWGKDHIDVYEVKAIDAIKPRG